MGLFSFEQHIVDVNVIKQYNSAYVSSVKPHPKRSQFYKLYTKRKSNLTVRYIVNQVVPPPTYIDKLKWSINRRLTLIKNLLHR